MGQQTEEQFLPTCSEMHNPSKLAKETQRQLKNLQNVDWFKSPQLHVEVYLSKILNPKLLLMISCMAAFNISI